MTNPILDRMSAHASVRRFAREPVPDADVLAAVRAAQQAATSSHVQAYALLRVRDPERRARLAELAGGQEQVRAAGAFFVVCSDHRRHLLAAQDAGRPREVNLETFLVGVVDASLFAQNLVLAFESQGWGTCYIGGLRNRLPEVDSLLALPTEVLPLYGLCVGRPAPDAPPAVPRPRLAPEAVLLEERYPEDARMRALVAAYDARMREDYARRGKPGYDWSGGVTRLFQEPRRPHLRAFYEAKGARFR